MAICAEISHISHLNYYSYKYVPTYKYCIIHDRCSLWGVGGGGVVVVVRVCPDNNGSLLHFKWLAGCVSRDANKLKVLHNCAASKI